MKKNSKRFIAAMMALSSVATAGFIFAVSNITSGLVDAQSAYNCDVNNDGKVNIMDLNIVKNAILKNSTNNSEEEIVIPDNSNMDYSKAVMKKIITEAHQTGVQMMADLPEVDTSTSRQFTFKHSLAYFLSNLTADNITYNHGFYMIKARASQHGKVLDSNEINDLHEFYASYKDKRFTAILGDVEYVPLTRVLDPDLSSSPTENLYNEFVILIKPVYGEAWSDLTLDKTMVFGSSYEVLDEFFLTEYKEYAEKYLCSVAKSRNRSAMNRIASLLEYSKNLLNYESDEILDVDNLEESCELAWRYSIMEQGTYDYMKFSLITKALPGEYKINVDNVLKTGPYGLRNIYKAIEVTKNVAEYDAEKARTYDFLLDKTPGSTTIYRFTVDEDGNEKTEAVVVS